MTSISFISRWLSAYPTLHQIARMSHRTTLLATNAILRLFCPPLLWLHFIRSGPIRLHVGCGEKRLPGFFNVDARRTCATDYVCDVAHLGLPPKSIERLESYHVIEHLTISQAREVLRYWHSLLTSGGILVVECPDFGLAATQYLAGNRARINNIFGHHRFPGDSHQYGYDKRSLEDELREAGFSEIRFEPPTDYHVNEEPCIRAVAIKT